MVRRIRTGQTTRATNRPGRAKTDRPLSAQERCGWPLSLTYTHLKKRNTGKREELPTTSICHFCPFFADNAILFTFQHPLSTLYAYALRSVYGLGSRKSNATPRREHGAAVCAGKDAGCPTPDASYSNGGAPDYPFLQNGLTLIGKPVTAQAVEPPLRK